MPDMLTNLIHRLVAQPQVYDLVQFAAGAPISERRLRPLLAESAGHRVLDVGGGTGWMLKLLPPSAQYLWVDVDFQKLQGLRAKYPAAQGVIASGTELCLQNKSVDDAICVAIAHHLTDAQVESLFNEVARVIRRRMIFLEPLERKTSFRSNLLWRYDRGSHPRSAETLTAALEQCFTIQQAVHYSVYHTYLLCVCIPKA